MSSGIYIATSGAVAQDQALDVTAHNIANGSTSGYKAERVTFSEALARSRSPDAAFAGIAAVATDSAPGVARHTGNPLDLALFTEDGYFGVNTPAGVRYTRNGDFHLDAEGRLVNSDGFIARGNGGSELRLPPDASQIVIGEEGTILADGEDVGQLEIVRFAKTSLQREGDNLYAATGPQTPGDPAVIGSGALEDSNVNVVRGVVDLVRISRTYESLMRMIQGYRDMESAAARGLGRPR